MSQLRGWIDAYTKVDPALFSLVMVNPIAAHGIRRAAAADNLIIKGRCIGLNEATIEEIAAPYLDRWDIPWDKIWQALIDRAMATLAEDTPNG